MSDKKPADVEPEPNLVKALNTLMADKPSTSVEAAKRHHELHGDMDGKTCLLAECALHYPNDSKGKAATALTAMLWDQCAQSTAQQFRNRLEMLTIVYAYVEKQFKRRFPYEHALWDREQSELTKD